MVALTLKRILGVLCLVIGLIALVTPFTPGSWLMFVGIELLGLTFLLPRPVRSRWEALKMRLIQAWKQRTWLRWHPKPAVAPKPHPSGRNA